MGGNRQSIVGQKRKQYKVVIAQSGKLDVESKKRYIIETFKYRSYDIYMKPQSNHLLFYTVDEEMQTVTVLRVLQDGMDWKYIIEQWITQNS